MIPRTESCKWKEMNTVTRVPDEEEKKMMNVYEAEWRRGWVHVPGTEMKIVNRVLGKKKERLNCI